MKKFSLITLTALASTGLFASCPCFGGQNPSKETVAVANTAQTVYHLNIQEEYLDYIINGKKISEGRLNIPEFIDIKPGDFIYFYDNKGSHATCTVTSVGRYDTFSKMLVSDGVVKMLPEIDPSQNSSEEMVIKGVDVYDSFPGYKEKVKIYGAITFGLHYNGSELDLSGLNTIKIDDR